MSTRRVRAAHRRAVLLAAFGIGAVTLRAAVAAPPSLIPNGSLRSGLEGWGFNRCTGGIETLDPAAAPAGLERAARVDLATCVSVVSPVARPLREGVPYVVSAYLRASRPIELKVLVANAALRSRYDKTHVVEVGTEWSRVHFLFTSRAAGDDARLWMGGESEPAELWVTGVTLHEGMILYPP